jgi:hypothetical protein
MSKFYEYLETIVVNEDNFEENWRIGFKETVQENLNFEVYRREYFSDDLADQIEELIKKVQSGQISPIKKNNNGDIYNVSLNIQLQKI